MVLFGNDAVALIYGYTYVVVGVVIIATCYHVASKVKLLSEFYTMIDDINSRLGNITIVLNGLKINLKNIQNGQYNPRFNFLSKKLAIAYINEMFDCIINDIIRVQQAQLIQKIESMDDELTFQTHINTNLNHNDAELQLALHSQVGFALTGKSINEKTKLKVSNQPHTSNVAVTVTPSDQLSVTRSRQTKHHRD